MDVAALAASQISQQLALTQSQTQVSMVRQQNQIQQQMIAMLTEAVASAPVPSVGTGSLLNVYA